MSHSLAQALYSIVRMGDIAALEHTNVPPEFKSKEFQIYYEAAKTGQMEVIDWLKQNGYRYNHDIQNGIVQVAGEVGDMNFIEKLQTKGMLITPYYIGCSLWYGAIKTSNIILLEWLKTNKLPLCDAYICDAVEGGNFWFVRWCDENGYQWKDLQVCNALAEIGDLENLKWVISQGCPWGDLMYRKATHHKYLELLEWIIANKCPIPKWLSKNDLKELPLVKELHPCTFALMNKLQTRY